MLDCLSHDDFRWTVEYLEKGQISAIKYVSGKLLPDQAAENFAEELYEETAMTEAEILRFCVFRESTDERFLIDVSCRPTYVCDTFFVRDNKINTIGKAS